MGVGTNRKTKSRKQMKYIDPKNKYGYILFVALLVIVMLLSNFASRFGGHLGQLAVIGNDSIYQPLDSAGLGFVGHANELFELLVDSTNSEYVNTKIKATDIDSLNLRYKALQFEIVGGGIHRVTRGEELRLVSIFPDSIKDEKLKMFFNNSSLPSLLEKQRKNIADNYFYIKLSSDKTVSSFAKVKPITIDRIFLTTQLFRVALTAKQWEGEIYQDGNSLFGESFVFLSNNSFILPVEKNTAEIISEHVYRIDIDVSSGEIKGGGETWNYYKYYEDIKSHKNYNQPTIKLSDSGAKFSIACGKDSFVIHPDNQTNVTVYQKGTSYTVRHIDTPEGQEKTKPLPIVDGTRLVVYNGSRKAAEFTLFVENPALCLSRIIRSEKGKQRYFISQNQTDILTQQVIKGLARNLSNTNASTAITLSIDPLLSMEFQEELRRYLLSLKEHLKSLIPSNQKKQEWDISLTIMDLVTGNIIASPYWSTRLEEENDYPVLQQSHKNTALLKRYVGSTFKPLLALASVCHIPDLMTLKTTDGNYYKALQKDSAVFLGYKISNRWAEKTSHWSGCSGMAHFLSRSDDVYPVALAAYGFAVDEYPKAKINLSNPHGWIKAKGNDLYMKMPNEDHVNSSKEQPLLRHLAYLYNLNYNNPEEMDLWGGLPLDYVKYDSYNDGQDRIKVPFALESTTPDMYSLQGDLFLQGEPLKNRLATWVLGQGDNEWNCLKVAEAWTRMMTMRHTLLSFVKRQSEDNIESLFEKYQNMFQGKEQVWSKFIDELGEAALKRDTCTYWRVTQTLNTFNKNNHFNLSLYAKTGTPDDFSRYPEILIDGNRRYYDLGMFTFSLVDKDKFNNYKKDPINGKAKGITCVLRITRSYDCLDCINEQQKKRNIEARCSSCKKFNGLASQHAFAFFVPTKIDDNWLKHPYNDTNDSIFSKLYYMTQKYY